MTLRFTDGVSIDTSGDYRVIKLKDGWYVTGHGMLSPENSYDEAKQFVDQLTGRKDGKA